MSARHSRSPAPARRRAAPAATPGEVLIRPVKRTDLDQVVAIDATVTGLEKRRYWERVFRRYGAAGPREQRHFLVALDGVRVVGFIIGEVRDWEFGSPPCGWVFGIDVRPDARQAGVGSRLLAAIVEGFRRAGVTKVRTILARENSLVLSFFRSQGLTAGHLIPLQIEIEAGAARA